MDRRSRYDERPNREFEDTKRHISGLRAENATLQRRLARKDRDSANTEARLQQELDAVKRERDDLRKEIDTLRRLHDCFMVQDEERDSGSSTTQSNQESSRVVFPSFKLLPKWSRSRVDITKAPAYEEYGNSIRIMWSMVPNSELTPQYLLDHRWELSLVFSKDNEVTGIGEGQSATADNMPGVKEPSNAKSTLSEAEKTRKEGERTGKKIQRRLSKKNIVSTSPRNPHQLDCEAIDTQSHQMHAATLSSRTLLRGRPEAPNGRSLKILTPTGDEFLLGRQFVSTAGRRTLIATPTPSVEAAELSKFKCVLKLCDAGSECRHPRCIRLHPGDWDPSGPEWIVEGGPFGRKESGVERRTYYDIYRPGPSDYR